MVVPKSHTSISVAKMDADLKSWIDAHKADEIDASHFPTEIALQDVIGESSSIRVHSTQSVPRPLQWRLPPHDSRRLEHGSPQSPLLHVLQFNTLADIASGADPKKGGFERLDDIACLDWKLRKWRWVSEIACLLSTNVVLI